MTSPDQLGNPFIPEPRRGEAAKALSTMVLVPSEQILDGTADAHPLETDTLVAAQNLNYFGLALVNSALIEKPETE